MDCNLIIYIFVLFLGFLYGTETLKSLLIMLALVAKHIDVVTAVQLSRLEQDYQVFCPRFSSA